tara:strand:- start:1307 stop:2578 length:1272 start_codon:yes stop_codon:yes gene_type:complete
MNKIEEITFPKKNKKEIYVALSGGVDSSVLGLLAKKHYGSIKALYIDHGQVNSKNMEKAAITMCEEFSIDLEIKKISPSNNEATETELRKLRFEVFNKEIIDKGNILLLGHQSGDRVETFFINLLRGTRLKGLGSISKEAGTIFRPLLDISKEEIVTYAKHNSIPYTEDPSNSNQDILRNWVRRTLLPLLSEKSNRNLEDTVKGLSREIKQARKVNSQYFKFSKGYAEVPLALVENEGFKDQNLLIHFLEQVKEEGVEIQNIDNVYSTINSGKENLIFGNWRASLSNGLLIMINPDLWPKEVPFFREDKITSWNNFSFEIHEEFKIFNNWNFIGESEKIKGKILIRRIKPSDTIETDTGSQKVSELLRSAGISNSYRKVWPIFSDDEKVFWIPGIRTSRAVYYRDSSKDLLSISGKLVLNFTD